MTHKLKDLSTSITIGQIMSRVSYKDDEEPAGYYETVKVLVPSAISGGTIHWENLGTAHLKKPVTDVHMTKKNDIVIKLSSPYDCALVTAKDEDLVVPSFCAVIRGVDENCVDVRYLAGYLNSAYVTSKLVAGINSSAMAMLRGKTLAELDVVLPDMWEQRTVGDVYWASCRKKFILQMMTEQQQQVSDSIIIETLKELTRHGRSVEKDDAE